MQAYSERMSPCNHASDFGLAIILASNYEDKLSRRLEGIESGKANVKSLYFGLKRSEIKKNY